MVAGHKFPKKKVQRNRADFAQRAPFRCSKRRISKALQTKLTNETRRLVSVSKANPLQCPVVNIGTAMKTPILMHRDFSALINLAFRLWGPQRLMRGRRWSDF